MEKQINGITPTDQREGDILELCKAVVNVSPNSHYNPNGADTSTCPLCHEQVYYMYADIKDIPHSKDCAYLIAKDLSTGLL